MTEPLKPMVYAEIEKSKALREAIVEEITEEVRAEGLEREISYAKAIREALEEEMRRDKSVICIGEDVRFGAFGVTVGLEKEFGEERVRDTPISEVAIIGSAVGAALTGIRPVAEMQLGDFVFVGMDQVVNQMAKLRYMSGGKAKIPVALRIPMGAGISGAAQHSQSLYPAFLNFPGLKIAVPSTPYDAKGLLKTAIRDDSPVLFFEHKNLYMTKGRVPREEYTVPMGVADVKREGEDVTVIATLWMLWKSLAAAKELEKEGISAEVIDPRTLIPLDKQTIINSVKKTGRVVIVDEAPRTGSAASEIAAVIAEKAFDYLEAPIKRVTAPDVPIPYSPPLEEYVIPSKIKIIETIRQTLEYQI